MTTTKPFNEATHQRVKEDRKELESLPTDTEKYQPWTAWPPIYAVKAFCSGS